VNAEQEHQEVKQSRNNRQLLLFDIFCNVLSYLLGISYNAFCGGNRHRQPDYLNKRLLLQFIRKSLKWKKQMMQLKYRRSITSVTR